MRAVGHPWHLWVPQVVPAILHKPKILLLYGTRDRQNCCTAGRGKRLSPHCSLYHSILEWLLFAITAPGAELGVRIKWPNDLYLGAAKVGGVLCNSVYRDRQFQVPPCTQASTMCSKTSTSHYAWWRPFNCTSHGKNNDKLSQDSSTSSVELLFADSDVDAWVRGISIHSLCRS